MRAFAHCLIYFNVFMAGAWLDHFVKTGDVTTAMWGTVAGLAGGIAMLLMTPRKQQ